MKKQQYGKIVNISSVAGKVGDKIVTIGAIKAFLFFIFGVKIVKRGFPS